MPGITEIATSFIILVIIEVVLGIDNIICLIILSQKLPKHLQSRARQVGLTVAWIARLALLTSTIWIMKFVKPLFHLFGQPLSGHSLFLLFGGVFLIAKATQEIYIQLNNINLKKASRRVSPGRFLGIITQIVLLDLVFSLDSILAAIGLVQNIWLIAAAITLAIISMLLASESISKFIENHPSIKILALSYLLLIGMSLIADGLGSQIPREYLYFAIGFSLIVEFINLLVIKRKN